MIIPYALDLQLNHSCLTIHSKQPFQEKYKSTIFTWIWIQNVMQIWRKDITHGFTREKVTKSPAAEKALSASTFVRRWNQFQCRENILHSGWKFTSGIKALMIYTERERERERKRERKRERERKLIWQSICWNILEMHWLGEKWVTRNMDIKERKKFTADSGIFKPRRQLSSIVVSSHFFYQPGIATLLWRNGGESEPSRNHLERRWSFCHFIRLEPVNLSRHERRSACVWWTDGRTLTH